MPATRRASKSPARERPAAATTPKKKAKSVTWNVEQSPLMVVINNYLVPVLIMISTPYLAYVVTYITDMKVPTLATFINQIYTEGGLSVNAKILEVLQPTAEAATLLLVFNFVALLIYWWPGKTEYGPVTINGHQPEYADNGVAHSVLFTLSFLAGSDLFLGWYKLSVLYDHFPATIGALNFFGLAFCAFLYAKGRYFPSGPDSGTSGHGPCFDYYWGMELYPRVGGAAARVDVKKFVNCRFSMTYWMLAGISFFAASYEKHGIVDPGLLLCALSQFLYLCKFYVWEIGYMRSIDIIVDRAGFYETWGCLVWVPAVYTLHTRTAVNMPSGLSWPAALLIFAVGILGVGLNFWADDQRQRFRAKKGDCLIWGRKPVYIEAQYATVNPSTGAAEKHTSLLLASGWWGTARHNQYLFELTAAYSWGFLAGVHTHGLLPLFYPVFLTILLVHRAHRDEEKCLAKYGKYYEKYMDMVPYKIVPFVY